MKSSPFFIFNSHLDTFFTFLNWHIIISGANVVYNHLSSIVRDTHISYLLSFISHNFISGSLYFSHFRSNLFACMKLVLKYWEYCELLHESQQLYWISYRSFSSCFLKGKFWTCTSNFLCTKFYENVMCNKVTSKTQFICISFVERLP